MGADVLLMSHPHHGETKDSQLFQHQHHQGATVGSCISLPPYTYSQPGFPAFLKWDCSLYFFKFYF